MPLTKESLFETLHIDQEGVDRVIERTKKLIHEGNVRRLIVKNAQGVTLIEVPLTMGVVGAVLVPVWAAIAAIAAIATDATVVVEKRPKDDVGCPYRVGQPTRIVLTLARVQAPSAPLWPCRPARR
jgi:hypothetical protein